jgi:Zn-dependent protease with chaperone function
LLATLPWILLPTIFGAIVGQGMGAALGLATGLTYVICAIFGSEKLPVEIYEGRLVTPQEMPEMLEIVEYYARRAGIPAPDLYLIAIDQPNVIAWASSDGTKGVSRIGIPSNLEAVLTPYQRAAVMALAVARIASGEAAVLSKGGTLAGLSLQFVFWKLVNGRLGFMNWDADTRLTPIGTFLLALAAPGARLSTMATVREGTLEFSDAYAARMMGNPAVLAAALLRLGAAAPEPGTGALRAYNPGLTPLFLVSPFDKLGAVLEEASLPAKIASWITDPNPSCVTRAEKLNSLRLDAPQATKKHETDEDDVQPDAVSRPADAADISGPSGPEPTPEPAVSTAADPAQSGETAQEVPAAPHTPTAVPSTKPATRLSADGDKKPPSSNRLFGG